MVGRSLFPEKSKTFLLSSSLGDLLLLLLLLPDKRGWDSSRLPPPPPPPVRRVMSILDSRNLVRWLREPPGNIRKDTKTVKKFFDLDIITKYLCNQAKGTNNKKFSHRR
jgi:hypothetical protein